MYKGTVYRGMRIKKNTLNEFLRKHKVGSIITTHQFVSTSIKKSVAHRFKDPDDADELMVFYTINAIGKSGKTLSEYGFSIEIGEVLFPPRTKFRVLSITKTKLGINIKMQEL